MELHVTLYHTCLYPEGACKILFSSLDMQCMISKSKAMSQLSRHIPVGQKETRFQDRVGFKRSKLCSKHSQARRCTETGTLETASRLTYNIPGLHTLELKLTYLMRSLYDPLCFI